MASGCGFYLVPGKADPNAGSSSEYLQPLKTFINVVNTHVQGLATQLQADDNQAGMPGLPADEAAALVRAHAITAARGGGAVTPYDAVIVAINADRANFTAGTLARANFAVQFYQLPQVGATPSIFQAYTTFQQTTTAAAPPANNIAGKPINTTGMDGLEVALAPLFALPAPPAGNTRTFLDSAQLLAGPCIPPPAAAGVAANGVPTIIKFVATWCLSKLVRPAAPAAQANSYDMYDLLKRQAVWALTQAAVVPAMTGGARRRGRKSATKAGSKKSSKKNSKKASQTGGAKRKSKKSSKKSSKKASKKASKKSSKRTSLKGGAKRKSAKKASKKASKKSSKKSSKRASMKGGAKRRGSKKTSKKTSKGKTRK